MISFLRLYAKKCVSNDNYDEAIIADQIIAKIQIDLKNSPLNDTNDLHYAEFQIGKNEISEQYQGKILEINQNFQTKLDEIKIRHKEELDRFDSTWIPKMSKNLQRLPRTTSNLGMNDKLQNGKNTTSSLPSHQFPKQSQIYKDYQKYRACLIEKQAKDKNSNHYRREVALKKAHLEFKVELTRLQQNLNTKTVQMASPTTFVNPSSSLRVVRPKFDKIPPRQVVNRSISLTPSEFHSQFRNQMIQSQQKVRDAVVQLNKAQQELRENQLFYMRASKKFDGFKQPLPYFPTDL